MIRVGVIGYGYWGPNLVRNLYETPNCTVAAVSDLSHERLAAVEGRYPNIRTSTDAESLLRDNSLDAIAIVTPVSSHYALAMAALQNGKHVLVEKPIASTSQQARRLIDEAERRHLTLMVDHTFVYTGAVRKIRELIVDGDLGDIYYYDSTRVNLGLFQHDVNVLWDLAVHDLAIMLHLLPMKPIAVSSTASNHFFNQQENIAYLTLYFEGSTIGHVNVNWLSPVKIRRTLIGASKRMILYDDLEPSEKIKVYDKGVTVAGNEDIYQMLVAYRSGDMWAPKLDTEEALRAEVRHFVNAVESGTRPLTDGESGLKVVEILEAAAASIARQGAAVELGCSRVPA